MPYFQDTTKWRPLGEEAQRLFRTVGDIPDCLHHIPYGTGVRADRAEAIKWLRSVAAQGHENAVDVLRELEKQ